MNKPSTGRLAVLESLSPVWLALGIMLVGLAARLYNLDARSFWEDEVTQAHVARFSTLDEVLNYTLAYPDRMPLMNVITWLMRGLGSNEIVVRLPAVIAGSVNVFAVYLLGRELAGVRVGLVGALLMALSPREVWFGQEGRPYALLLLFTTLQMLFAYRAVVKGRRLDWVWLVLCSVANLYTHYLGLAATASAFAFTGLVLLVDMARSVRARKGQTSERTAATAKEVGWKAGLAVASLAAIMLAYVPWLPQLNKLLSNPVFGFDSFAGPHTATLGEVQALLDYLDLNGLVLFLFGIGVINLSVRMARGDWKEGALLFLWIGLPLALFWIRLQGAIVMIWPRYFLFLHPAALLLAAWGVEGIAAAATRVLQYMKPGGEQVQRVGRWAVPGVVAALLVAAVSPALAQSYGVPKSDYRGMARYVIANSAPDSIVISVGPHSTSTNWGLRYYFWRLNSPISYADGAKLDDLMLARIEGMKGEVWGSVHESSPAIHELERGGWEVVPFAEYALFRRAPAGGPPLARLREILSWSSRWHPELVSSLDLIEAWSGSTQPGANLLPPANANDGQGGAPGDEAWALSAGAIAGEDGSTFALSPNGEEAKATWRAGDVAGGERYIFQFEYRNPELTGNQHAYVYAYRADGAELEAFPTGYGHPCDPSADWKRGMFAFTLPVGTDNLLVKLAVRGAGKAEFRDVSMWRVK